MAFLAAPGNCPNHSKPRNGLNRRYRPPARGLKNRRFLAKVTCRRGELLCCRAVRETRLECVARAGLKSSGIQYWREGYAEGIVERPLFVDHPIDNAHMDSQVRETS